MLTPRYFFSNDFKEYEQLFYSKSKTLLNFKSGEYLCGVDSNFESIYYIIDGTIKLSILHESGHEKCISFHGTGDIQPYYYSLNFKLERSLLLTAITDVTVLSFNKNDFYNIIKENHELYDSLLNGFVKLVNLLMCETTSLLYDSGLIKVCNFLYSFLQVGLSTNNIINISQHDLSTIVGMNRINTAKYLKKLRDEKIIATSRNKITILNKEKLYNLCSDEYID